MNIAVQAPTVWRCPAKPVAVIGAGIAGLTAAYELERRGIRAAVFESGRSVGGMASSFKDAEGYTYDFGAHFVSNRLADAMGASAVSRTVRHYGEAVALGRKSYSYPFGLALSPRYAASAVSARLHPRRSKARPTGSAMPMARRSPRMSRSRSPRLGRARRQASFRLLSATSWPPAC